MSGAASRTRGANAERQVVNYLKQQGWSQARRVLAGDGHQHSDIECWKKINTSMNRLNSSNISNEGRQSNRGDYSCSSSSSGNVAGSSLEGVAVLAACFELGKVLTQALCSWGEKKNPATLLRACRMAIIEFHSSSSREQSWLSPE